MITREYIVKLVIEKYKDWYGVSPSYLDVELLVGDYITQIENRFYSLTKKRLEGKLNLTVAFLRDAYKEKK